MARDYKSASADFGVPRPLIDRAFRGPSPKYPGRGELRETRRVRSARDGVCAWCVHEIITQREMLFRTGESESVMGEAQAVLDVRARGP